MTYNGKTSPREITQQAARKLLASCDKNGGRYRPLGLFYLREGTKFIGIDNGSENAWTEELLNLDACLAWLQEGTCAPSVE